MLRFLEETYMKSEPRWCSCPTNGRGLWSKMNGMALWGISIRTNGPVGPSSVSGTEMELFQMVYNMEALEHQVEMEIFEVYYLRWEKWAPLPWQRPMPRSRHRGCQRPKRRWVVQAWCLQAMAMVEQCWATQLPLLLSTSLWWPWTEAVDLPWIVLSQCWRIFNAEMDMAALNLEQKTWVAAGVR